MDLENRRGGNGQSTDWPDGHMVSSVPFSAPLQSGEQSGRLPQQKAYTLNYSKSLCILFIPLVGPRKPHYITHLFMYFCTLQVLRKYFSIEPTISPQMYTDQCCGSVPRLNEKSNSSLRARNGSAVKSTSCSQRALSVQFPAPTHQLSILRNSSSRGSDTLF